MKLIKQTVTYLTPDDEKGNRFIPFVLEKDYKKLVITCCYSPKILEDEEKAVRLIKENLERDAGDDSSEYSDYSEFMPLKNLITLAVESPDGFIGSAHRQAESQRHEIGEDFASVGFVKTKITKGQWTAVLNCHAVVTDSVKYEIRIEAEEGAI